MGFVFYDSGIHSNKYNGNLFVEEEREMKCNQCGECCKWVVLDLGQYVNEDKLAHLKMHEGLSIMTEGSHSYLWIMSRCANLTGDGKCKIHDSPDFPKLCKRFPSDAMNWMIPEKCGYRRRGNEV
jgi:hypothetical protein